MKDYDNKIVDKYFGSFRGEKLTSMQDKSLKTEKEKVTNLRWKAFTQPEICILSKHLVKRYSFAHVISCVENQFNQS